MLLLSATLPRPRTFCLVAAIAALALPFRASAVNGTQLLQAQLPVNTTVPQATCEQLTRAVTVATEAHRADAAAILTAALTRGARKNPTSLEAKLPCLWVSALLHASVVAAPGQASSLMELASSLYPDCADALEKMVELFDDKNVVDDKTVVDDKNGPARAASNAANPANAANPTAGNGNGNAADPGDLNLNDPEVRDLNYAGGYGPGFPGAPGFVGSAPNGGVALPPPSAPLVTPVAND